MSGVKLAIGDVGSFIIDELPTGISIKLQL